MRLLGLFMFWRGIDGTGKLVEFEFNHPAAGRSVFNGQMFQAQAMIRGLAVKPRKISHVKFHRLASVQQRGTMRKRSQRVQKDG